MNSQENAVKENQAAESSCLVGVLPGVSMGGVMEGTVREEWKGEGRAREGGGACTNELQKSVCTH